MGSTSHQLSWGLVVVESWWLVVVQLGSSLIRSQLLDAAEQLLAVPSLLPSSVISVSSHESATFRGVGQPLLREGGPISYEARPSGFFQRKRVDAAEQLLTVPSPLPSESKSFCEIALLCSANHRIPASSSTHNGIKNRNLIPL